MKTEALLLGSLLIAIGPYLLWTAYQIQFKNRVDLVQFGSGPLPGASLLKRQFSVIHLFHGLTCLLAGLLIFITNSANPGIWIFAGVSLALAVRRQLLIRAIEIKAANGAREA